MKVVLAGYPGSQFLVPASKYLTEKYLPGFHIEYLNYEGEIDGWSKFLAAHLEKMVDDLVIFALDDYMLCAPLNQEIYEEALKAMKHSEVACVKIHFSTPEEHEEYPVTTQYTVWRRQDLINLLKQTLSPWEFEMRGSRIFRYTGKKSVHGFFALPYFTSSALSGRWKGLKLNGLKEEDVAVVNKLIGDAGQN